MSNNSVLNRVFSKATLTDLINNNENIAFSTTIERYIDDSNVRNNKEVIKEIYKVLLRKYRNEYVYKNTLLNKLLLGRHSIRTTTALTEVTIGKSKADFILINGSATVYEIKTDLDSLVRLKGQLENYYKAFSKVYVITGELHYEKVNELLKDSNVGICLLTNRNTISEKKKAVVDYGKLDYETMFRILRKDEYEEVIFNKYKELPKTSQVKYYRECFSWFKNIEIKEAYERMLKVLKRRNKVKIDDFKDRVPKELSSLVYFSSFKKEDYTVLEEYLEKDYRR